MVIRVLASPQKFLMSISLFIFPPSYFSHLLGLLHQDLQLSYFLYTAHLNYSVVTPPKRRFPYLCLATPVPLISTRPSPLARPAFCTQIYFMKSPLLMFFSCLKLCLFPKSFWEFDRQKDSPCGGSMDRHSTQSQCLNVNSKPQNISMDFIKKAVRFVSDGSLAGRFGNLCCI